MDLSPIVANSVRSMLACSRLATLIQVNPGWPCEQRHALCGLRSGTARGGATKSSDLQIAEQTVRSAGPVGAVGLLGKAVRLQDTPNLPASPDDLESYSTGSEFAVEVVQHLGARQVDKGRGRKTADDQ